MLSIGKLTAAQSGYYERQVARGLDDYYSGRGEAAREWLGRGAEDLGLAGEVDEEGFAALMAGLDPSSGERLGGRGGNGRVAAFDLTFSAPKSVSVLFAIEPPETEGALVAAHREAVAAAVRYLEADACWVRRGRGGVECHRGAGLVAAAYRHWMSRAEDPQLHTHVVAANLTRGDDRQWSALDGRALYAHAKAAAPSGALGRGAGAAGVGWVGADAQRDGRDMRSSRSGGAGVLDTPASDLERERELVDAGVAVGPAARERVAHATRDRKRQGVETAPWQ